MFETKLKKAIDSREYPLGTWISIGHPTVAEVAATCELDFVLVDTEHTTTSLETVEEIQRGIEAASETTETVVRVPWNDPVRLKRILDIGVAGVMVPMVETPAEARDLVKSLRFPPEGNRGIAASRATRYGRNFEEYVDNANKNILTIAQIETEEGLENAEAIAGVDGINALFVGPADLSGALGMFGEWDSPAFADTVEEIVDASHQADTPVGTLTIDVDEIQGRLDQRFDFLIAGKDTSLLMDSIEEAKAKYEQVLGDAAMPSDLS